MSQAFLIGGFIGFALTFFATLESGGTVHFALRNGMIGCLVVAIAARFIMARIIAMMVQIRLREIEKEAEEESPS